MNIGVKLQRLNEEDFIWIVYFFIIIAALYSNHLEREYYEKHDKSAFPKQKTINIIILSIAFFIYLYFLLTLTEDLGSMEKNFNNPTYVQTFAKLIGAILFLVAGAIYVITEIFAQEPDEIGVI